MDWVSFLLLGCALLTFLISTRQMPLSPRALFWLAGAALLIAAAWFGEEWREYSFLVRIFQDSIRGDLSWAAMIAKEWRTVGQATTPMFGITWVIAAFLGLFSLFAFTPGESLEKIIRPIKIALLGAIGGSFVALAAVAIGFAGYYKHGVYSAPGNTIEVHDGDTFIFGDTSIRLVGIDAPELHQTCSTKGSERLACGLLARDHLSLLIGEAMVTCENRFKPDLRGPQESFGRPLLQCFAKSKDATYDLGLRMIEDGYAFAFQTPRELKSYDVANAQAKLRKPGLLAISCVDPPWSYRRGGIQNSGWGSGIGACPVVY